MTEYILVFRKPGESIYKQVSGDEKKKSAFPINRLFTMDIANNVWHIAPVPPDVIDHPCPFPEEIPDRLIRLYSYADDVVLDPFAGSGQTLKVAQQLDRQYVGYETIEKYVQLAKTRVKGKSAIRPQQLIARFDKIAVDEPAGKKTER
jgi:site-specific DNA-methyltransferase (adenine-specific)